MKQELWFWPSGEEVNDFPDPIAFDAEWQPWRADLADGPSKESEIFAREYIQNSWDTIQAETSKRKKTKAVHRGAIKFSFVELTGKQAKKFYESFGLSEFRDRFNDMTDKNRKDARLGESEIIQTDSPGAIKLLICSESGGGGMWGHWFRGGSALKKGSRLRFALIQTQSEKGEEGSGGSWGHGKKAIANASKARVLGVYTCHEPQVESHDKPGVTRRFIGVAYWRSHEANDREHVGLGVLGQLGQTGQAAWQQFEPLENEKADAFVSSLGIEQFGLRNAEDAQQRGTSYLIIEPSFTPADLVAAIERNWWPLTIQHKLPISVVDFDGTEYLPEPEKREELLPFVDAFRAATGAGGVTGRMEAVKSNGYDVGSLAVLADVSENGFSYRADIEDNTNLIALIRNDLVISYLPSPKRGVGKPPFVRGALNVDRQRNAQASELLKMAEPHLHNEWRTQRDGSTPQDAANLAKDVIARINRVVREVQQEHMKPQDRKDLNFDQFSDILSGKEKAQKRKSEEKTQPVVPREFRIHNVSQALVDADPADPTKIRISAFAEVSLSPAALKDLGIMKARVRVQLAWKVLEEGLTGTEDPALFNEEGVKWPTGFREISAGKAEGIMTALPLVFNWRSSFFPDDWQLLPFPKIEMVEVMASDISSESEES